MKLKYKNISEENDLPVQIKLTYNVNFKRPMLNTDLTRLINQAIIASLLTASDLNVSSESIKLIGNLLSQFSGRCENQCKKPPRLLKQVVNYRQSVGCRFSRPRFGNPDDIVTLEGKRNCLLLNVCGLLPFQSLTGLAQLIAQALNFDLFE